MKLVILFFFALCTLTVYAQHSDNNKNNNDWKKMYRASATKINDLVDTKLEVKFDYDKQWMYGKAWITLHPQFYPTDSLTLDTKSMAINKVALVKGGRMMPLQYKYDSSQLFITLDKMYKRNENYVIYIDYISRPNTVKSEGSAAITDNKGLYFINPKGEDKNKPTQIWTQGETESNSAWFPTIDKPNQKTTEQIRMTVLAKYVTLSNGSLISKKNNSDGTRTDTWKMTLPHSPYLFFMGVGDYAIIKDSYKGKEVSYYVEKEFAPVARKIFGYTPEMIAFYSRITGVDFPWPKYAQITGRDYVSGAMENTTSTLHSDAAQQDARELKDGNRWEEIIAHELFHQWFGDYVTTESWSNITVNESFADYSETLWDEYKHGKDEGDAKINADMRTYLNSPGDFTKPLVRFYYANKEDVFDNVSYPKGGSILHMLRNYVGDSAFFKSLNLYLITNKFGNGEAQQLRLAFEQITGEDLNWFWNEWYYGAGHPKLNVTYGYDEAAKTATVQIKQTQSGQIFTLPFAVDVYSGGSKKRYNVWMKDTTASYSFPVSGKPDLINFDGTKVLLCEKTENKTMSEYVFQYKNAGLYRDRREAITFALSNASADGSFDFLKMALGDKSPHLREMILNGIKLNNDTSRKEVEPLLLAIAKTDTDNAAKAKAIQLLSTYKNDNYKALFIAAVHDSSYTVAGAGLKALAKVDSAAAVAEAKKIGSQPAKRSLRDAIVLLSDESNFDNIIAQFDAMPGGFEKLNLTRSFIEFLNKVNNTENFKKAVDRIIAFRDKMPASQKAFTDPYFATMLQGLAKKKTAANQKVEADYILSQLETKP